MFLTKDNSIKWKWLLVATFLTIVLCIFGVMWFDKPVFIFMRNFDFKIWQAFDILFAAKIWLITFFLLSAYVFVKNEVKSNDKIINHIKKFKLRNFIRKFIEKTKGNKFFVIFCSILTASIVGGVLKFILGRQRPIFLEALDQYGFYPFTPEWAFNSMPSGHAVASFAALVMIGLLYPKFKWATWTFAIVIGVSRICFGAHFPSDVILGAFIGMVSADFVKAKVI